MTLEAYALLTQAAERVCTCHPFNDSDHLDVCARHDFADWWYMHSYFARMEVCDFIGKEYGEDTIITWPDLVRYLRYFKDQTTGGGEMEPPAVLNLPGVMVGGIRVAPPDSLM